MHQLSIKQSKMTYNGEADNINTLNHDILIIFFTERNEKNLRLNG